MPSPAAVAACPPSAGSAAPPSSVLDVVIVGAGLAGLTLANTLCARGLSVRVLEARDRAGGRAHTVVCPHTGQALDMGPTWWWPDTEPRMARLLSEHGLASHPQHDTGQALWLTDPQRAPDTQHQPDGTHAGAQRIVGGVHTLVHSLINALPPGVLHTLTTVQAVRDAGAWLEVQATRPANAPWRARQVVLALPPRLVHQHIRFQPELPAAVDQALQATPTWMAAQAKVLTTYEQAFWRHQGQSGNAFVRHPQAVLAEVFDASPPELSPHAPPSGGALGGFVALSPAQRQHFQRGLPLLVQSQLTQLFGQDAAHGHAHTTDWALEPWTCSALDTEAVQAPPQSHPLLRQGVWGGRLWWGGSETATHGWGHMEGALDSADRLGHALTAAMARPAPATQAPTTPTSPAAALATHAQRVHTLVGQAPALYQGHVRQLLSAQDHTQLTQRALLATADQVYSQALTELDALLPLLAAHGAEPSQGRHPRTPELLAAFEGWNKGLLDAALAFNQGSCALSRLPDLADEVEPGPELRQTIARDLAAAWREFALTLNTRLLSATPLAELP